MCLDFNKKIEELIYSLNNNDVAILYGTGLCYNSGILTASDFYNHILGSLKIDKYSDSVFDSDTIDMVKERTSQFEDFLMRFNDDLNLGEKDLIMSLLMQAFTVGQPNTNHFFLADLMQKGFITAICTTNFDQLFEKAYSTTYNEKCGFPQIKYISQVQGIHHKAECKLKERFYFGHYKNVDPTKTYIKLHGCVSELGSISTFLPRVSSKSNVECINTVIDDLFKRFKYVLVMGYSFSDAYDIVKVLCNMGDNVKANLIIVNHIDNTKLRNCFTIDEYLRNKEKEENPSKIPPNFKGIVFECKTDNFIETVWKKIGSLKKVNVDRVQAREESERCIQNYVQGLRFIHNGYYIYLHAWRFHYEIGQNLFLVYKQLSETNDNTMKENLLRKALSMENALEKSIENAKKSIEVIRGNPNIFLAKKHKLLSEIALKSKDKNDVLLYLKELKKLAEEAFSKSKNDRDFFYWAGAEIFYFYLLWKYELSIYNILDSSEDAFQEILSEINNVYIKIKPQINLDALSLVFYRLSILRAIVCSILNFYDKESENDLIKAESILYEEGRVEYLTFLHHGYAKIMTNKYIKTKDIDIKIQALDYYEKAIYLYKNLGDSERKDICIHEREELKLF